MFEGLITDLLNRVLGTYVENLDGSKLKLSIWGGDVQLKDLDLKQSALNELDLPVALVFGNIGSLTLKIPWKNLYTAQWVAIVERVVVVAVPNTSINYNAEREDKMAQDVKMAMLQRGEEARQKAHKEKEDQSKTQDGFVEKLLVQVVRNIQVIIKDIHIRYEDSLSCPDYPFAAGVTLHDLSMQSTDANWRPCLDTDKLIYKLNNLDSLAVYWNANTTLLSKSDLEKETMIQCLISLIASQENIPQEMKYIIGPICSTAKLQLNPKPETDEKKFSIPKVLLDFVMDELSIGVSRHQYSAIMALLESLDRLRLSAQFRKHRPTVKGIKGNAKQWWHYAYNCKLENIQRIHQNWSWEHMKNHRNTCRKYKASYKAKLENKKLTAQQTEDLQEGERKLDVFNITVMRRQAEMEVEREGKLRRQAQQQKGWFGGWFSWGSAKESEGKPVENNIVKKFEAEMNDEEKMKLYDAIGYSETGLPPEYPPEFVDLRLQFLLRHLVLIVTDEEADDATVTKAVLSQVTSTLLGRSAASAVRIEAAVQSFFVDGYATGNSVPHLVISENTSEDIPLLDVTIETNPQDKLCDQRVRVSSEPLQILYHAETISSLQNLFAPPENVSLQQLQAATLNQLEVVKERSVTGLQSAIDDHSVLDLNIAFAASHIIVPDKGAYSKSCSVVVLTLGSFLMKSVPRDKNAPGVADLVSQGHSQEEVMETVRSFSYDKFTIDLADIQAVVAFAGEDWHPAIRSHDATPLHLLQPTTLHVELLKCLLTDDPNLPKVKVSVTLTSVALSIVDERLLQLAYIAHSIPGGEKPDVPEEEKLFEEDTDLNMNVITEDVALARLERVELNPGGHQQDTPQFTNLHVSFVLHEVSLELKRATGKAGVKEKDYIPLINVMALSASVELTLRTFDLNMSLMVGGLLVQHMERGEHRLLSTPQVEGSQEALLVLKFLQVNPKSPDFRTKHQSTVQFVRVNVSCVKAKLEHSAILSIMSFWDQLSYKLNELAPPPEHIEEPPPKPKMDDSDIDKKSVTKSFEKLRKKASGTQKISDIIALRLQAELGQVSVIIAFGSREVAQVDVAGLMVNVKMEGKDVTVTSQLKDFTVIDPTPAALHPKIVEVVDAEAWDAQVSVYGEATEGENYLDMKQVNTSLTLTFGCARIVFLNKFVADVLSWVDKFQSAKAAVASASMAAAAAAQTSFQEAYDQCSRVSLALTVRAPLILIPQDSHSLSGLMLDLGLITINNKFELGKDRNELGYPVIYDKIRLELHNVKLSRVDLTDNGTLEGEHELLQPISLNINVCRNLAIAWYKQCPEIDIKAKLKPIKMSLSEEDLLVTLTVLQDNLGEKTAPPPPDDPSMATPTAEQTDQDVERVLAEHGHVFTKVKFAFTVEAVTLILMTGGRKGPLTAAMETASISEIADVDSVAKPNDDANETTGSSPMDIDPASPGTSLARVSLERESTSERRTSSASNTSLSTSKKPLAEFSLQVVTLKGDMQSDGSLSANVVLVDCILQDTRPGRGSAITRMMERKVTTGNQGMIDLTYRQGSSNDTFVDVKISGFVLVMHLPYLLRIQSFFMDNLPQSPDPPQPAKSKEIKKQKSDVTNSDGRPSSMMTVRVKVEQPDIAVVEDVTTPDTSCIILHAEIACDIKITPQHQHISAILSNLQMYTCCYNPSRRLQTLSQILNRCEMALVSSSTPSHAQHVDFKMSRVELRVSPGTIELLSTILTTLSAAEKCDENVQNDVQEWSSLWEPRPLDFSELPFLAVEEASEAFPSAAEEVAVTPVSRGPGGEMLLGEVECLLVTLEAGSGTTPIPLIKFQTSISTTITGFFSSKVKMNGSLSMEIVYYNARLAVWEPLLEPVETPDNFGEPKFDPWRLNFELEQELASGGSTASSVEPTPVASPEEDEVDFDEEVSLPSPIFSVSVEDQNPMQLTVTKTFMDVANSLSEAFAEAYKRQLTGRKAPLAPYHIINQTGMVVHVALNDSSFKVAADEGKTVANVIVESGAEVDLFEEKTPSSSHKRHPSLIAECQVLQDRKIELMIPSLDCKCSVPVMRADKRFFQVENKKSKEKWGLVASISVESGCKVITLSSCVQVKNHLDVSIDVYFMTERGNELEYVLSLEPESMAPLPLHAIYTPTAEIFFSVFRHSVCIKPFIWRDLQNNPSLLQELQCLPRDTQETHSSPFLIAASGEVEPILWEETSRRTIGSTINRIHLRPLLVLHNLLPVPISLEPPGTMESRVLMPGASLHLTKAQLGAMYLELQLLDYQARDWICGKSLEINPPELSVWTFESRGDNLGGPLHLDLGMLVSKSGPTLNLSLYCPFWMVNKTGLMLTYRKSRKVERTSSTDSPTSPLKGDAPNNIVVHEEDNNNAVLFSFKSKAFFGKKKATVKVEDSDWSQKFSLDVVGSSGSVTCKSSSRSYLVGVDIQLGGSGLTKIVIFSPFYKIFNKAPYDLEVMEVGIPQAEWFTVLSGECIGWWPAGAGRLVRLRVRGTTDVTAALSYDRPICTLLRLPNKYGGVFTEVSHTEAGVMVKLDQCYQGATTALLINHLTNTIVSFWQEGLDAKKIALAPRTVHHYTWEDPAGTFTLCWQCGAGKVVSHSLDKDGTDVMNESIHWVVFLSGNQRCVLFTDDINIASSALHAVGSERIHQQISLSLSCIGLSLVDDVNRKEVAYISLASTGVVWEHRKVKGKKHRLFTQAQTELLEKCYQLYMNQVKAIPDASARQSHFVIARNLEVDYASMTVSKPFNRCIRRVFRPGVWSEVQISPHQRCVHLRVNSLQIDNQMNDVMFPVVLARVPTPRGVMAETVPKAFFEMSVVQMVTSPVFIHYKYLAVLMQEFHIKVELPFVFAVMDVLLPADQVATTLYSVKKFEQDSDLVHSTLTKTVQSQATGGQRDYYEHMHLSPIKMHLSFSLTGLESGASVPVGGQVIHLFLQSVGVTLTEVQDVVFRLNYMERLNAWMTWGQLMQEMISHYRGQVIKQLYVLVLGLDVIGNPFGLVIGLTKGVEDLFYEPIQGAIEGPGEFAEGMFYGVTSFMGKTVGGAAGAVSRITGTIGKGVAALTLDDDYQRRRREAMNRKPADGIESLARGGKGIVTGVFDGVTGVFLKPIEGARDEGVEGFFKGVGKGMMGLVTRPASGVIDFASGSFEAVKKATDSGEEISRRRSARYIAADGVVRPYVEHQATGAKLLRELEKGRYAETDVYVAHVYITASKSALIATDKRIMCVTRNDILGHHKVDWLHSYEELSEPPILTPKGIRLSVQQEKKRVLSVFGGGDNSKVVHASNPDQAQWFVTTVWEVYLKTTNQSR